MKILTPDLLMHKCLLYDDNGMAYITALNAYTTLYTEYERIQKKLNEYVYAVDMLIATSTEMSSYWIVNTADFEALEKIALRGEK